MIVEYIRYRIEEQHHDAFATAYKHAADSLVQSPHCIGYELTQCKEEPSRYVMRIEWTSFEGHMAEFRASQHFRNFLPHVRPFIESIEEMQHYQLTEIVWSKST